MRSRPNMLPISRHTFIRLVLGTAGVAMVGNFGCGDAGTSSFTGRRRTDPTGATDPSDPEGEGLEGDGSGEQGAVAEADAAADPAGEMAADAGADPALADSGGGGAADAAPANACTQALALSNANGGITSGHAHAFTIPAADFLSTTAKTYTMSGGHAHTVTLTPAQLTMLRAGQTVNVTSSSTNNHTHACTIKCA